MKGIFISIEGGDGAGKTTQINNLTDYLSALGHDVFLTREPGGTAVGEAVRDMLLYSNEAKPFAKTELLLLAAARAQHLEEKILPALSAGKTVICDRFSDSTIAYQGFGRGLGMDMAERINHEAVGENMPDLTIYLDINPKEAIKRKQLQHEHTLDRMEKEDELFRERVYEGYQQLCKKYPKRIRKINAENSPDEVFSQIKSALFGII